MKFRNVLFMGIVLMFSKTVFAQDTKIEVTGDYSFVHVNPQNNNIIGTFNVNGGGGSIAYYFSHYVGIEGELQGYGSYTKFVNLPAGSTFCPGESTCTYTAQGNLFTYNVGPVFKYRTEHFEPFGEVLFGGAHTNFDPKPKNETVGKLKAGSWVWFSGRTRRRSHAEEGTQ